MVVLMGTPTATGTAHPDLHTQLYWESTGDGPPVLLVMGLGLSGGAWWRTVDALSRDFRVITFDNRGVGRSRGLTPAYTTEALADDAAAVLDGLEIAEANVYGLSLGGMVAQQLALRHPRRVRSLVLGATTPGGRRARIADEEVMEFFRGRAQLSREEAAWASVPYNYGRRCRDQHADRIAEDIRHRLAYNFDEAAYQAQLMAATFHNTANRLRRIGVPALVVHGEDDRVVPVDNAHLMADRLPHRDLHLLPGTGHLYTTEVPEADAAVARFLANVN
jgi:pimeloyl-ACP methyl ester carboxylesterase